MEHVVMLFDDSEYDRTIKLGAADGNDLEFVFKDKGTTGGNPIFAVRFSAEIDGKLHRVKACGTVKTLLMITAGICGRYPELAYEMRVKVVHPTPPSTSQN